MVLQKLKLGRTSNDNNDDKKKNLKESINDEGKLHDFFKIYLQKFIFDLQIYQFFKHFV